MQKIIFYQEVQPKAADALWLHHGYDEEGNKKESISIDYIQNGVVRHIMDAGEGGSSDVSQIIANEEYNFDSTKSYFAGDIVVKDGLLYTFTDGHAAGEWNESDVEATNVLANINNLWHYSDYLSEGLHNEINSLQGQITSLKKALGTLASGGTLCFTSLTAPAGIGLNKQGTLSTIPSLEYSMDGVTWQTYIIGSFLSVPSVGSTVYFRSDGTTTTFSESDSKYLYFEIGGRFEASGSVMSLIDKNLEGNVSIGQYCFTRLFYNCTGLTTAPELPATTLANNCYRAMFNGCTSLTTAPALPATTLASSCYRAMFQGCTSLTTAPELSATTLADFCYFSMFQGCTSLTTAPELPATTLASDCYDSMFKGCTSLTSAPELPATTLVSYCYNSMFNGCSHLSRIKAMFTTTPSISYTDSWVKSVAARGVFIKNANATWNVTGINGIPSGWTVETASE